jgi:acyl carrier protein
MAIGTALTLAGVVLFAKKGTEGRNVVKMLGFEFQLAGSALVVLVLGVMLLIIPFVYPDSFRKFDQTRDELPVGEQATDGPFGAPANTRTATPPVVDSPSLKRDAVRQRVREIVASQLGRDVRGILDGSSYVADLGADDLDTVEMVMALEEEFKIDIPDSDAERLPTVGATIAYVMDRTRSR